MMFKCPVCRDLHRVNDKYDNDDYICSNTVNRVSPKTFQNMVPVDLLEKNMFLNNTASTKVDERRATTVIVKPTHRTRAGSRIGTLKKNW